VEQGSLLGRLAVLLLAISSLVLLVGLLVTLPRLVPGAMCAAGVLEALPAGRTMVGLRIATLLAATVWARLDGLNRGVPLAPLVPGAARALLVMVAVGAVASWRTAHALLGLELDRTVSCCTILYDLAAPQAGDAGAAGLSGLGAAAGTAAGALAMVVLALAVSRRARGRRRGSAGHAVDHPLLFVGLGAATAAWALSGSLAVVDWSGPHVFGALGHRCPWCLFLPIHGGYGWWAWGTIALGAHACVALLTAEAAARRAPSLRQLADRTLGRSGPWLALLAILLCGILVGPVAHWRSSRGADLLGQAAGDSSTAWAAAGRP
jgi:hypothetical protein